MIHRGFVASNDDFMQSFLEQRFGCGASNLFVIFKLCNDLWIPVVKTCDISSFVIFLTGTRGPTQFKGFFGAKWFVIATFTTSVKSCLKKERASWWTLESKCSLTCITPEKLVMAVSLIMSSIVALLDMCAECLTPFFFAHLRKGLQSSQ